MRDHYFHSARSRNKLAGRKFSLREVGFDGKWIRVFRILSHFFSKHKGYRRPYWLRCRVCDVFVWGEGGGSSFVEEAKEVLALVVKRKTQYICNTLELESRHEASEG